MPKFKVLVHRTMTLEAEVEASSEREAISLLECDIDSTETDETMKYKLSPCDPGVIFDDVTSAKEIV